MRRFVTAAALTLCFAAAVGAPLAAQERAEAGADDPTLDEVRTLAMRYRSIDTALADGYVRDPSNTCEDAAMMGLPDSVGAMGIHVWLFRENPAGIFAQFNPAVSCEHHLGGAGHH